MIEDDELLLAVDQALVEGEMGVIRIHEFALDGDEQDDPTVDQLLELFRVDFRSTMAALTNAHGQPTRSRTNREDDAIPLCGLCEFAVWDCEAGSFFFAVAHEDRGAPILLMVGPTE